MSFISYTFILLICAVSCTAQVNNCTLLSELEYALYNNRSNEGELNRAFFPPRAATSRYLNVLYNFMNEDELSSNCTVKYVWAIGGFLLIQPPSIFQFLSLLFSNPANDLMDITITLPYQCLQLITVHEDGNCSCKNQVGNNLDILTQQIMQYSKFNDESEVVRDETSTAQSLCFEELNDLYSNESVTPYLSGSVLLPVAIAVPSLATILCYYDKITINIGDRSNRPSVVGAAIAGLYITGYVIAMDIFVIKAYDNTNFEYANLTTRPLTVRWYYVPVAVESSVAAAAVLIIGIHVVVTRVYPFFKKSATFEPLSFLLELATFICSSILILPIVFVSAHIDNIFAAWLTEPSKTTSIAIMALTVIFFLFVMHRTLYTFFAYQFTENKRFVKITKNCNKYYCKEILAIIITLFFGLCGAVIISLQIAAFYVLPIPSASLPDYLENIVQIALVILASLISYKIISFHESDTRKMLKKLDKSNKRLEQILKLSPLPLPPLKVFLSFKELKSPKIMTSSGKKTTLSIGLTETSVGVNICSHEKEIKKHLIPTSEIELILPPFQSTKNKIHIIPLEKVTLTIKLADCTNARTVKINLKDATLIIGKNEYLASQIEVRVEQDNTFSATLARYDDIESISEMCCLYLPCCVAKHLASDEDLGSHIHYDSYVTITPTEGDKKSYLVTNTTTLKITEGAPPKLEIPGCEDYELGQPVTLKGHSAKIMCCLELQDGEIIFKYIDENTLNIVAGIDIDVCLDSSIAALELIFDSQQSNGSGNTGNAESFLLSSQSITIDENFDCHKSVTITKECDGNNELVLNLSQGKKYRLINIKNGVDKNVKISYTLKYLHIIMKKVIKIERSGKICSGDHVILDKMRRPYDLTVQPNPIESCDDISFLKFSTPQET